MLKKQSKRKCPICNSQKTTDDIKSFSCQNCGYVNLKQPLNSNVYK